MPQGDPQCKAKLGILCKSLCFLLCGESTLQLDQVSPALAALAATAVPMPGQPQPPPTRAAEFETVSAVTVAGVDSIVTILKTKTRPKKLALLGSDGRRYTYPLKVRAGVLHTLNTEHHIACGQMNCTTWWLLLPCIHDALHA